MLIFRGLVGNTAAPSGAMPAWNPAALLQPNRKAASTSDLRNHPPSFTASLSTSRNRADSDASNSLVFQFASSSNDSASDAPPSGASTPGSLHAASGTNGGGVGNWLERANNIQSRGMIPQVKRRKIDEDLEMIRVGKDSAAVRSGSGMLGDYVKEKQKQGNGTPSSDSLMVDLTNGK